MMKKEIIKKALKSHEIPQFYALYKKIAEGNVLSDFQQRRYDTYLEQIESYQETDSLKNPFAMSIKHIAQFFNTSATNIFYWQQKEGFPQDAQISRGVYDLFKIHQWWRDYFYGDEKMAKALTEEKLKYQQARSRREELVVMELEGQMKQSNQVIKDVSLVFSAVAIHLKSLHKRLPPLITTNGNTKKVAETIEAETHYLLTLLSDGLKKLIESTGTKIEKALCGRCKRKLLI